MESYLLIGLGNVGEKFDHTRHNTGIRVLRAWVKNMEEQGYQVSPWRADEGMMAEVAAVQISPEKRVWCLFPLTMMNDSGEALVRWLHNHPVSTPRMLVVHDDLETAFGEVQLKTGGSAKGHNGLRSIHEKMASQDIARLLVGIGRPPRRAFHNPPSAVIPKDSAANNETVGDVLVSTSSPVSSFSREPGKFRDEKGYEMLSQEIPAEKFVLQKFSVDEEEKLSADIVPRALAVMAEFVASPTIA